MTPAELREALSAPSFTADEAFAICRDIGICISNPSIDQHDTLDVIVRLAARRNDMSNALNGADQIINDILRRAGLYPYIENEDRWSTQMVCDLMKVPTLSDITLHLEQMKAFGLLISGKSLILSAPTSFGKSLMVDALISLKKPSCVVIVVPTLALLDEYRKRLKRRFPNYTIITHDYQMPLGGYNIYIGTQERIAAREIVEHVNLFVIDEFYKLDLERGDERALALNAVMARYAKTSDQIYLLGPSIDEVSKNIRFPKQIVFHRTTFSPVATDIIDYTDRGPNIGDLVSVLNDVKTEPTLIFVRSPESAARLTFELISRLDRSSEELRELADWLEDTFHPEWALAKSVTSGIGIHHGRIPRSVGQYLIYLFNCGRLPILICTSTLIEGVNTAAKNIIIYDKFVSTKKLDRFTFDNIKGRAGRMFQHYVGRVFLFNPPPEQQTFTVNIPLFSGFESGSEELLMHVPPDSLSPDARRKREQIIRSSALPADILQRWSRFGIDGLNSMRDGIQLRLAGDEDEFIWSGFGEYKQIAAAFSVAWNDLTFEKHGMKSPNQAAFFSIVLRTSKTLRNYFDRLATGEGLSAQKSIDQCFNFLRGAEYTFPEVLRAVEDVANFVSDGLVDYSYFATSLQGWFLPGNLRTLEEFGVPMPLIQKFGSRIPAESPDEAYSMLNRLSLSRADLFTPLEKDILAASYS